MTPTATNEFEVQKTVFDLDQFDEVLLVKTYTYEPVATTADALARLGNDSAKLLKVINDGLRAETQRQVRASLDGWMQEDEEGNKTPFSGAMANLKIVNACVLNLAKTVFGFAKDLDKDAKRTAKESAKSLIQNTPAIRAGLQKSAAVAETE